MLDVAGGGAAWPAHEQAHLHEEAGEELRDLYVALTRAQSQVVTWWAPTANTQNGGLHRLLFGRQPGQSAVPDAQAVKDDDYVTKVLGLLDQLGGPSPEESVVSTEAPVAGAPVRPATLAARAFDREVDTEWRRTSYSGLIRVQEQPVRRHLRARGRPGTRRRGRRRSDGVGRRGRDATRPEAGRAVARWPRCRAGRRSGASSTGCSRRATPRRPTSAPSWPPTPGSSSSGGRSASVPTSSPTRCCPRSSPRSAPPRRGCAWSTSRCVTGSASSTSSSR